MSRIGCDACAWQVSLYGLVKIQSFYLPFAFACISLLMGQSIVPDLLGIVVGHIYHYLKVGRLEHVHQATMRRPFAMLLNCTVPHPVPAPQGSVHHSVPHQLQILSCTPPCPQDIYPRQSGNNVLTTPGFLRQWCADAGLRGSAPPPREAAGQPQGFQAFRGSGRRLGGQ
jgi:hypothetical protein